MKVLMAHNHYQQPGGEDQSFESECALLRDHGHDVETFTVHNDAIEAMSRWSAARKTLWNRDVYRRLRSMIRREQPDVAHFQNTFPLLSPSVYHAAAAEGVAVVETLRNYRLTCANGQLYRDSKPCELCLGKRFPVHGVRYACYRDDRAASFVVGSMLALHHALGTWRDIVDRYIALTEFAREKLVTVLPSERVVIKPNFLHPDPGPGPGGEPVVFVGRLSAEKGLRTLLRAWLTDHRLPALRIVGDGPLRHEVMSATASSSRITWLGHVAPDQVRDEVSRASLLIFPSEWYEGQPRTILEAYASGTPVIGARIGSVAEMIDDGETGWLFSPGDHAALASAVLRAIGDRSKLASTRTKARREFERRYTSVQNIEMLEAVYLAAIDNRQGRG